MTDAFECEHVILVACTRNKLDHPAPAEVLYASPWFQQARQIAKRYGTRWWILSGKYGLIDPDQVVAPYDVRLGEQPPEDRERWAHDVAERVRAVVPPGARVTLLADEEYGEFLVPLLGKSGGLTFAPLIGRSREAQRDWLAGRALPGDRLAHLERLYVLLDALEHTLGGAPLLRDCRGTTLWPRRGLYFFFDDGEPRWLTARRRVIRVGTHAVSRNSKSTLWNRLRTHRGSADDRGNHRGSVFRLHVGAALIARDHLTTFAPTWGRGQVGSPAVRAAEVALEQQVSTVIGGFRILWVEVPDDPSPASDRAYLEQNTIALLSGGSAGPLDPPTAAWLGGSSPTSAIRMSGLWNVDHVMRAYDPRFLDVLEAYIEAQTDRSPIPTGPLAPAGWHPLRERPADPQPSSPKHSD